MAKLLLFRFNHNNYNINHKNPQKIIQQIHHQQQFKKKKKNMVVRQSKFWLHMNLLLFRLQKKHPKL